MILITMIKIMIANHGLIMIAMMIVIMTGKVWLWISIMVVIMIMITVITIVFVICDYYIDYADDNLDPMADFR